MDLASFKKNNVLLELLKAASPMDVGLSYHWDDKETVEKLRDWLVKKDLSVWVDAGFAEDTTEDLIKEITKCKLVVVFVSKKYENSANCKAQLKQVDEKVIPIVLVCTDGDYELENADSLELIKGQGKPHLLNGEDDEAFDKVVNVIVDKVEEEQKKKEEE